MFVIILGNSGTNYDEYELGQLILDYEDWGCISPPGPNSGFGGPINPDFLQDNMVEMRSRLSISKLEEIGILTDLANQIFPYMDGIFRANKEECIFEELPHRIETLIEFLSSGNEDDFIEIVEYEDG